MLRIIKEIAEWFLQPMKDLCYLGKLLYWNVRYGSHGAKERVWESGLTTKDKEVIEELLKESKEE